MMMMMMKYPMDVHRFLVIFLIWTKAASGHHCFYCANTFNAVDPLIRRQLSKQDIFFYPVGAVDPACHLSVSQSHNPAAQICYESSCVTITPNIQGVNFTVRGCSEQLFRYSFKVDQRLQEKSGCFLTEATDYNDDKSEPPISFIICQCASEWCNNGPQPGIINTARQTFDNILDPSASNGEDTDSGDEEEGDEGDKSPSSSREHAANGGDAAAVWTRSWISVVWSLWSFQFLHRICI